MCVLNNAHLFGDGWLYGHWDDGSEDAAIESSGELSGLVWSEDQCYPLTRLHQLTTSNLVQHVESHLL